MTTQYTPILQLALPVTGELNGTWGDVVNDNITSMVEEAIAGLATISTWTTNAHTLTTADGTTDEARCAMLVLQTGSGGTALSGAGQVICPARTKLYVVKNDAAYAVTVKTSGGSGVAVAAGDTAFLFCDGTNVNACVTQIINGHITGNLTVDGNATVNGNTTLGNATSDTITATARFASDVNPSADNTYDLGTSGNSWRNLFIDGTATIASLVATTADINGGTIDATSIGATTPSTGVFTQVDITAQGDLRLQDASGGQYVAMQAPATVPASYTLTMPDTDGDAGQALITDGSGNLSWSTAASGDVYGPASATDNAIARFDGTTGKLIQNSAVTIGDDGATVIAANSTSDGLRITQIGAGNALVVEDSANPDSTPTTITKDGDVIIGGTAGIPSFQYSNPQLFIFGGSAGGQKAGQYTVIFSNDIYGPSVELGKSRSTTIGTVGTIVQSGDELGIISFNGDDGTDLRTPGATIRAQVDGTPGTNDMPGRLVFSTTADGASSPTERMRIDSAGQIGIGGAAAGGRKVDITGTLPAASGFSIPYNLRGTIPSGATTAVYGFYSTPTTEATAFTLPTLTHFFANPAAFGAGSTVTNQYGFHAGTTLTGATNNYGFYGNIAAGTGRYNFYAAGTADNYFAGNVGIGSTSLQERSLAISKVITGGTAAYGVVNNGAIQSDVTNSVQYYRTTSNTQAASFTLSVLSHYSANQGTVGAGSAITSQIGYAAESSLTGATNNYGFYSVIASGTGRYNFYAAGTADNYFAGSVGIGALAAASQRLLVVGSGLTASTFYSIDNQTYIPSTGTAAVYNYRSVLGTAAASFTVANMVHYSATQVALGSGSSATNQVGFSVDASLTGATNNYGFKSDIASGTGRWNFYAAGTAPNYFAGNVGIKTVAPAAGLEVASDAFFGSANNVVSGAVSVQCKTNANWNYAGLNLIRCASNTGSPRFIGMPLDGDSLSSTTIGEYNAIWGAYDSAPTTGSTSAALNSVMVYGAYAGHRWVTNGTERMRIGNSGNVGIGLADNAISRLMVGGTYTSTAGLTEVVRVVGTCPSTTTSSFASFQSYPSTQAAAFTVTDFNHFRATQNTIGAGSTVTNQYGFNANGSMIGATNNYGFKSDIAAGTGRYNFYAAGTADNYFAGPIGISSINALSSRKLSIGGSITGSTGSAGIVIESAIQSDVTSGANYIQTYAQTAAAAFTLLTLRHFFASQGAVGSGSAITNQRGFEVESTLTGATNNFGFQSNIASGTGRWNFYASGTADNYFAGSVGIGVVPSTTEYLKIGSNLTGTKLTEVAAVYQIQNDVTGTAVGFVSSGGTQAGSNTIANWYHFRTYQGSIGAGSSVTNQVGYYADATMVGATYNFGFYGNIPSGAGRWNIYCYGTAANWFSGDVLVFGAGGLGYTTGSGGAVTQTTSRTTGVTLNKTNGAITLVSAAGSTTVQSFTVTNSTVAATDTIIINQKSGTDLYEIHITAVAAGSFRVSFKTTGGTTTEQPVFNFAVIKAVTA